MFCRALSCARYRTLSTESYGALWKSGGMMKPHEASWRSPMESYGGRWSFLGALWNPREFYVTLTRAGASCGLMEPFGDLRTTTELYGALCSSTEPYVRLGAGWSPTEPCEGLPSFIKAFGSPLSLIVLCRAVCPLIYWHVMNMSSSMFV